MVVARISAAPDAFEPLQQEFVPLALFTDLRWALVV